MDDLLALILLLVFPLCPDFGTAKFFRGGDPLRTTGVTGATNGRFSQFRLSLLLQVSFGAGGGRDVGEGVAL